MGSFQAFIKSLTIRTLVTEPIQNKGHLLSCDTLPFQDDDDDEDVLDKLLRTEELKAGTWDIHHEQRREVSISGDLYPLSHTIYWPVL